MCVVCKCPFLKDSSFAFYSVVDTNILYIQVTKHNSWGFKHYLWRTPSPKSAAALSTQIYPILSVIKNIFQNQPLL